MTYMEEKIHIGAGTIHRVLTIYNGLAVMLLAGFMAITQQKINQCGPISFYSRYRGCLCQQKPCSLIP